MSIQEIAILIGGGGGILVILLCLIKIRPIEIQNPITALLQKIGMTINEEVLREVQDVQKEVLKEVQDVQKEVLNEVKEVRKDLNDHIRVDDEREADRYRERILKFNNELVRKLPHTKEDFVDVLIDIDRYEIYCKEHEDYQNSRAVHAIANIEKRYDERLEKNDFAN